MTAMKLEIWPLTELNGNLSELSSKVVLISSGFCAFVCGKYFNFV